MRRNSSARPTDAAADEGDERKQDGPARRQQQVAQDVPGGELDHRAALLGKDEAAERRPAAWRSRMREARDRWRSRRYRPRRRGRLRDWMKFAAKVRSSAAICETTAEPSMTMTTCDDSAGQMRCSDGTSTTWRKVSKRRHGKAGACLELALRGRLDAGADDLAAIGAEIDHHGEVGGRQFATAAGRATAGRRR